MKELSVPFNLVDFFAYLGNGFVTLVLAYAALTVYRPSGLDHNIAGYLSSLNALVLTPLIIFVSYAVGQVVAHAADILFERILVGRILGHPRTYLLTSKSKKAASRWRIAAVHIFGSPNYLEPFPPPVLDELREKYRTRFGSPMADSVEAERVCFAATQKNKAHANRLMIFLAIYLFCRNAALVFIVSALVIWIVARSSELPLTIILILLSSFLLGRYLNFLRFYTRDVFIGFLSESSTKAS